MTIDLSNPHVLPTVPSDIKAAAIVAALRAQGIQASTTCGCTVSFRTEDPGVVNVIVRHEDLHCAKHVLVGIEKEQTDVDWSQVDVGEPDGT